jgi:hypothetical protein
MRLSELEFRVRQTETYIKYADELTVLKENKEKVKKRHLEKVEQVEKKQVEFADKITLIDTRTQD